MLGKKEICALIPHSGEMCLLDTVKFWDSENIICLSNSHKNENNPLRNNEGLPMLSLIEYGAQAVAVHGCLLAKNEGFILKEGYLAALHNMTITQSWLSNIEDELEIIAKRIYAETSNMIYTVTVNVQGKTLVSGRVTVIAKLIDKAAV